ncbi:MAG TPA: hypothetical protein VF746_11850 [Longimicrobium sp.]|jgi:hypothetical protein
MITLKEARDYYFQRSTKVSDIVRQLAFAGIAIIWLFKSEVRGVPRVPDELLTAGFLIIVGLALDLFQYVSAAILWGTFARYKERKGVAAGDSFVAPAWINWPALTCFCLKIVFILGAYVVIGRFLYQILQRSTPAP